jgi:DNA primase
MSVVEEVKQKLDIVEVIGQSVSLTKAGRNFKAPCPFHGERTPSFFVFPERQSWHCFGACSTGGDVFSFVMKQQGLEFGEALRTLADQAGVTIPSRYQQDTRKDERDRLTEANDAAARFFNDALLNQKPAAGARQYLQQRGFTADSVTTFTLGYSPARSDALKKHLLERGFTEEELVDAGLLVQTDSGPTRDRFRGRLMFPIRDSRGKTTGFGARALDDSFPKYTNSPQTLVFDKSGTLYAIDQAASAIRKQDRAVLVEGYMDAVTAHQSGFQNVIASMGTAITERQVSILKRLTRNVTLALDADTAGEEAMLRCVDYENTLDAEMQVTILPDGKDPDDVIRESPSTWQDLVDGAVPVVDYAFTMKTAGLDMSHARNQSQASRDLLPIVARMKDPVRRDHYLSRLAFLTGIRYNILETSLQGYLSPRPGRPTTIPAGKRAPQPLLRSHTEEYCLSLLLQHPELRERSEGLLPESFLDSQNRQIFDTWRRGDDSASLQDRIDPALREQVDHLLAQELLANRIEERCADCILRLREDFLKDLKVKRKHALSSASEEGSDDAARLTEDDVEVNNQLREVFAQKARAHRSSRTDEP